MPSPRGAGRGLGRGAPKGQSRRNSFEHGLQLREHQVVRKPKHADAVLAKKSAPAFVVRLPRRLEVLTVVQLDRERMGRAVKVEDVGTAGMLPAKLEAGKPLGPELEPENTLGVGGVAAEVAAADEGRVHTGVFGSSAAIVAGPSP